MKAVLLPVKDPANAKQRLAPLLSPKERRDLVWVMLEEIGAALTASKAADRIVLVGHDPAILRYGLRQGWGVIHESEQVSQGHSVDRASSLLRQQGAEVVLCVPGDTPLLQASDVDLLLNRRIPSPGALLVPSRDRSGTNALLRIPPDAFPSRFGKNSLRLHKREADSAGVTFEVIDNSRMALDLDEVADLVYFVELHQNHQETLTFKAMKEMGLVQRLANWSCDIHVDS